MMRRRFFSPIPCKSKRIETANSSYYLVCQCGSATLPEPGAKRCRACRRTMNVFFNRSRLYGQSGMGDSRQSKPLTVTRVLGRQGSISPADKVPCIRVKWSVRGS